MIEKVNFENEGQKIEGILHVPEKTTESLVILVHGFTGSKDGPGGAFIKLVESLASKGFAVLRFNFRFTTEDWSEFHNMSISGETSDLKVIIDEMSKRYGKIAVVGESMGGTISILGYDERVKCLVLWYPVAFPNEIVLRTLASAEEAKEELEKTGFVTMMKKSTRQKFKVGRKYVEEMEKSNLVPYAEKISCPTLLIHGDADRVVSFNQSERLLKILKEPKRLEKISGVGHAWHSGPNDYDADAQRQAIKLTVEWFEKWLK